MLVSARQLSEELGLTLQMLSVYAKCYTKMTKQQIKKQGRLGRHFTPAQREIIKNAREMVQQNSGVTVEDAMRKALVFDADALEPQAQGIGAGVDLAALKTAFGEALRQEVTAPLVAEIQALRREVEELKLRQLEPTKKIEQAPENDVQNSLFVKLAKRLEKWVRAGYHGS